MKNQLIKCIYLLIIFLPTNADANAGLPMISYGFPFMIILFLPVLLIEILIYRIKLDKSFLDAFKVAGIANIYTTLIGYPISWLFLLLYQMLTSGIIEGLRFIIPMDLFINESLSFIILPFIMPAWLGYFKNFPNDLAICLAGMAGLLPAYWITVQSEQNILRKYWGNDEKINRICILANRISYLFLYFIVIISYFYILFTKY
jgi:hypothetical protein